MSYTIPTNSLPTKMIYIDSRDANRYLAIQYDADGLPTGNSLTSYFQYILKENVEIPTNQRCLISLDSSTIPYSFYTIRKFVNDKLPLKIIDDDTAKEGTADFIIPPANYTAYTLATYLEANIPKVSGDTNWDSDYKNKFTLEITYSQDTSKFTFTFTPTNTAKNWSLYFNWDSTEIAEQDKYANVEMGFRLGSHRVKYASPTATPLESQNVVDISGSIHGVYIRTNLVSNATLDSQNGTFSNILARLPINVASGGLIFSLPSNNTSRFIVDLRSINSLTIRLTDERNRLVDLNGLHFQIAILCEFVYADKRELVAEGGLTQNKGGDSYSLATGEGDNIQKRIALNKLQYQKKLLQQQQEEREARQRGPGRPRRVGRPRIKRKVGRPVGS